MDQNLINDKNEQRLEQKPGNSAPNPRRISLSLIAGLVGSTFLAQLVVFILSFWIHADEGTYHAVEDLIVFTVVVIPMLYFTAYRPLHRYLEERKHFEAGLEQAKMDLESRVRQRTAALVTANQALQSEIEDRKKYEDLLRLQTTAMEAADNGILITNQEGRIEWVNQAFSEMTGYSSKEIIGKYPNLLKSGNTPRELFADMWQTILAGQVWHGELINRRKDGSIYFEEQTITPVRDERGEIRHFIAIKQDISERKQAEQAVENERKRLFNLLDGLPALVYLKDDQYNIRFTNQRFRQEFGTPDGRKCYQIIRGQDHPCEDCPTHRVLDTSKHLEWEWNAPNDRTYQLSDYPYEDVDGSMLVLQLGIDITDRKKAEAHLEQIIQELRLVSKAERDQRHLAENLIEVANTLSQNLDLNWVMETMLAYLKRLVEFNCGLVVLRDSDGNITTYSLCEDHCDYDPGSIQNLLQTPGSAGGHLSRLVAKPESVLLEDVTLEDDWFPIQGLAEARSWVSVPMIAEGTNIGTCILHADTPGRFSQRDLEWIEAVISQSAISLQNAMLYEQVSQARSQLQFLSRRLVSIQEHERSVVSRELHDEAGQALTTLMLGLGRLEKHTAESPALKAELEELKSIVKGVMEELHRLAMDLRPSALDHVGIEAALQQYLQGVSRRSGLLVQFESLEITGRLPLEMETNLFRIVQESLNNVIRHAHATRVDVLLQCSHDQLVLLIEDDGRGFDSNNLLSEDHLGLFGIQERVEMLNGKLIIESSPGKGTTLRVEVPCEH